MTENWEGSEAQQYQIREGVAGYAKRAIEQIGDLVGNHENLREKIFSPEEINLLMRARELLIQKEKK